MSKTTETAAELAEELRNCPHVHCGMSRSALESQAREITTLRRCAAGLSYFSGVFADAVTTSNTRQKILEDYARSVAADVLAALAKLDAVEKGRTP